MMVRVMRYLIGLVIAIVLLALILPHVGYPSTRFLPPIWVYQKAQSKTNGIVTAKHSELTNDPFRIGVHMYFIDYKFYAPPIDQPDNKHLVEYNGEIKIDDENLYSSIHLTNYIPVRYEQTYPWVNGVDSPGPGVGCGEGSNVWSGWWMWLGAAFVLGFFIMVIIDQFAAKQDI
jgi:hypothetical protein